jgi:hypothetical protein
VFHFHRLAHLVPVTTFLVASLGHGAAGAGAGEHWSLLPAERAELPRVALAEWPRNAIDYFVLERLEAAGLQPSQEADKRTLVRRISLDLTGLPPSLSEVNAFVADGSPDAYEKLIDRLLASPRYGERMALAWLDVARYADTFGYHEDDPRDMWAWRDWVIRAYNANMPFDQFTIDQLAGDLRPAATTAQRVASGFNRLHMVTGSGKPEEYRVEYVVDRVNTTATAWMGLTLGCARCHDHKYDPISQREYYQFFAFFNTISDEKIISVKARNVAPFIKAPTPEQEAELASLGKQIAGLTERLEARSGSRIPELAAWEAAAVAKRREDREPSDGLIAHYRLDEESGDSVANSVAERASGTITGDARRGAGLIRGAFEFDGGSYVDLGDAFSFEHSDSFSYGAWVKPSGGGNGAVLSRMDESDAYRGFDVYVTGGEVEIHMIHHWPENSINGRTTGNKLPEDKWTHVFVTYDGTGRAAGFQVYFNGSLQPFKVDHDSLSGTIKTSKPAHIARRNPGGQFKGMIDELRVYDRSLGADEVALLVVDAPVAPILAIDRAARSDEQRETLRQYYFENHDTEYQKLNRERTELHAARDAEDKNVITTMVMEEMESPRQTFFLHRGDYQQPGESVEPGLFASLPALPEGAPVNRLGVALWLVDPSHPLTSRVAVNRYWQMIFGTGIVKTPEDFGVRGERPSHPELLDWLATEFVRSNWNVKAMLRLILTSATYRQASKTSPALLATDPANRLLTRGSRFRLQAEMVRDNALAASGLLVEKIGGPSVRPYQPAGLWKESSVYTYEQDHGEQLYRRSMYTYWKRAVPPPSLRAMDAPNRELCSARRQLTNTPLMALVLMNDPTFVEAARALAQRMMAEAEPTPAARISLAFQLAVARHPSEAESVALLKLYEQQLARFGEDEPAAEQLLGVGESKRDATLDPHEHAAWTTVASVILNMDETITKE